MKYALRGTIVTFNDSKDVIDDGYVCVEGKKIAFVVPASAGLPQGFADSTVVDTGGSYIYPGLIDLHNHLPYNYLPLWEIDRDGPFRDRYQWPALKAYNLEIKTPTDLLATTNPVELVKYCEAKSLVGGVTTIDGYSKFRTAYSAWLLRNIEVEPFGDLEPPIYQSVPPIRPDQFADYSKKMDKCNAFIYHLAEGTSNALEKEYEDLKKHNLVRDRLVAIHCTALQKKHFQDFGRKGTRMVWSPLSNMLLYGSTARVSHARKNGVLICLGPDWTPTGSKNLLWELKVADLVNKKGLGRIFSDRELVEMVTINPAKAIRWDDRLGKIAPMYMADLVVAERLHSDPYRNLIKSTEKNIQLVTTEGRARYGDPSLLDSLGTENYETIPVGSRSKGIDILEPGVSFGDITLKQVKSRLTKTLDDPRKAAEDFQDRLNRPTAAREIIPQLIIEEDIPTYPVSGDDADASGSLFRLSVSDILTKVISMKDKELDSFPSQLDPLTIYESKQDFFGTLKSNKNVPTYLGGLENYLDDV